MNALGAARLPRSVALARLLGITELLIGASWLAFPSRATELVLGGTYSMLLVVGIALVVTVGPGAPCGCLGQSDAPFTATHAIYNLTVVSAAVASAMFSASVTRPSEIPILLVYGVAIGLATYLSYLLLTEFDGAARAFEGSRQRALSQTLEF